MSRELWQARMREISEEIRELAAREAALVAEWHRLEYALADDHWGDSGSSLGQPRGDAETVVEALRGTGAGKGEKRAGLSGAAPAPARPT
jgi:hypothetical protein